MKKIDSIIYWAVTGIFSLMLFLGATAYFFQYEMTAEMFTSLGVPTEIIYPLAIAKILGVIAILVIKNPVIKQSAYLGFALDLVFATIAHLKASDGGFYGPIIPLVLLSISFFYYRKKIKVEQ